MIKEKSIKVSEGTHHKLLRIKKMTGISVKALVDRALDSFNFQVYRPKLGGRK